MTLMTNDINDLQDDVVIGNYLTIQYVRNTAGERSGQSGSFKAGKHRFHNGKPRVSWQESLSARKEWKRAVMVARVIGK